MRKSRLNEAQTIGILREQEASGATASPPWRLGTLCTYYLVRNLPYIPSMCAIGTA